MSEGEARAKAERRFGDRAAISASVRRLALGRAAQLRVGTFVSSIVQDARFTLRALRREPAFALAASATLALGIGGNAVVFALTEALLLRRPAVHAPEDVVLVYTTCRRGDLRCGSSYPDYVDYRDRSTQLADLAAYTPASLTLRDEQRAERVAAGLVSGNFFPLLGVRASTGRVLLPQDDGVEGGRAVVLSHRFWQERFGGSADMVGRTIELNGRPYEVAGVSARDFTGLLLGSGPDVWVPLRSMATLFPTAVNPASFDVRARRWINLLVGRLAPGATVTAARAELALISDRLFAEDSVARGPRRTTVDALPRYVVPNDAAGSVLQFMVVLQIALALSMLLACANLANVLLARANARRLELGVRVALGAGERRLARQLLTESMALALIGGGAGLLLAVLMLRAIAGFQLPLGFELGAVQPALSGRVVAFGLAVCAATAVLCGAAPAVLAARSRATGLLRTARAGEARAGRVVRRSLVAVQVALSLVLVIGAALFAQTLRNRLRVDLGFSPRGLTIFSLDPAMNGYDATRADQVLGVLLAELRAQTGVRAASVGTRVPVRPGGAGAFIEIDGYVPAPDEELRVDFVFVGSDFTRTLGLPVLRGRDLSAAEHRGEARGVLIDRVTAERWWRDRDPVGSRIEFIGETYEIVGVVGRAAWSGLELGTSPLLFVPLAHDPARGALMTWNVLVRTAAPVRAATLQSSLSAAVRAADPALAPFAFATLADEVATLLAPQRGASTVLAAYALLALVVAAVGIYGVVSYSVTRQRHEFGVRLALGATPPQLLVLVLRGMTAPVLIGLGAGTAAALVLSRNLNALLFGVAATDAATYVLAAASLAMIAVAAMLGPARRATLTDPARVLSIE